MPDKIIYVNGVGKVRFPDTMGNDQIAKTIQERIIPQRNAEQRKGSSTFGDTFGKQLEQRLGQIFSPVGEAASTFGTGVTQLPSNPIAGLANIFSGGVGLAASPITVAEQSLRQIPGGEYVADAATLPFRAVGEGVSALAPPGEGETSQAVHGANQALAQLLLGAGGAKMLPKSSVPEIPKTKFRPTTVTAKQAKESGLAVTAKDIVTPPPTIPLSFRSRMIRELGGPKTITRFGPLEKLSDTDLAAIYQEKGLDKPAPLSEAPVSRGGSMDVRGPANQEQIAKIAESDKPLEQRIIKDPLHTVPDPIAEKIQQKAAELKGEVEGFKRTPGSKIFKRDEEGYLFEVSGQKSMTNFPDWWNKIAADKPRVMSALDRILKDKGKDKGKLVEELKAIIVEELNQGGTRGQGVTEFKFPADEEFGRIVDVYRAQGEAPIGPEPVFAERAPLQDIPEVLLKERPVVQDPKYLFNINQTKLDITAEGKTRLKNTVNAIKPELERTKGSTLTNDQVIEAAQRSDVLRKIVSRSETKDFTAALTKLRQRVAAASEEGGISPQFIEDIRTLSSHASDIGRKLQSFNITADPSVLNIKEVLTKELLDVGVKAEEIAKASEGVNWKNRQEVAKFYRTFVKPSASDLIREFQYINLLSSPSTHIVNAFSNMLQSAGTAPVTKLYQGGIDMVASALTGKQRDVYAKEVGPYYRGFVNAMPLAAKNALSVLSGKSELARPEFRELGLPSVGEAPNKYLKPMAKFNQAFASIPRLLEASDILFRTMIESGEKEALAFRATKQGKEVNLPKIEAEARKKAEYTLFRQKLGEETQGTLLRKIDGLSSAVQGLRTRSNVVRFFVPFLQTPLNIMKQGIEYSPAGFATIPGSAAKMEQLSKALVGSTVFAGAAALVASNESTWEAPKGEKQQREFYDTGKQPYSIKLGDTWVSYSRLGPLSYPIAMAAAVKYHTHQDPNRMDKSTEKKISNILGANAKFFSDQSYVQGLSSLMDVASGEPGGLEKALANIPQQMVPLVSLQSWVNRLIDPLSRKAENPIERIQSRIPGAAQQLPPFSSSERTFRILNSVSPVRVSADKTGTAPYRRATGLPTLPSTP